MSGKNEKPSFGGYWNYLWRKAQERGFNKGEWMLASNLGRQRFSEFNTGQRRVTARYFLKLIGGISMKPDEIEIGSGVRFTQAQRDELQFESWVDAHRDMLKILMKDPQKLKICLEVCKVK